MNAGTPAQVRQFAAMETAGIASVAFHTVPALVREHAAKRPQQRAFIQDTRSLDWAGLDVAMDRVAASLQRDNIGCGDVIAICAATSIEYACLFLGALRAGVAVAPLAPSSTAESLAEMIRDSGASMLFLDGAVAATLAPVAGRVTVPRLALDGASDGRSFDAWLAPAGVTPSATRIRPTDPFNIIYSSGTTGLPKGIVQSHGMRWAHVQRSAAYAYGSDALTLIATPLYSNTTLVTFFPTVALGGSVVFMAKFDAQRYLELAQLHSATHTMLVPVQYKRIMDLPTFGDFDLSKFRFKFCTSAPFTASLKADVLARWPGGLVEFYGMTEGGGTCILGAHDHPEKLHTVGRPAEGHDMRVIDEKGRELQKGEIGEIVGNSPAMMSGYHNQPDKTALVEWYDHTGKRFIRTGDVGRFDEDGFLILMDRRKDMVISGGFNIYPSDLEAVLSSHPDVGDCAVVGVPSEKWGETPVAFVVSRPGGHSSEADIMNWANARLGKTQRLSAVHFVAELPRSAIGKILKRELRDAYTVRHAH